jgi:hypothetical protein
MGIMQYTSRKHRRRPERPSVYNDENFVEPADEPSYDSITGEFAGAGEDRFIDPSEEDTVLDGEGFGDSEYLDEDDYLEDDFEDEDDEEPFWNVVDRTVDDMYYDEPADEPSYRSPYYEARRSPDMSDEEHSDHNEEDDYDEEEFEYEYENYKSLVNQDPTANTKYIYNADDDDDDLDGDEYNYDEEESLFADDLEPSNIDDDLVWEDEYDNWDYDEFVESIINKKRTKRTMRAAKYGRATERTFKDKDYLDDMADEMDPKDLEKYIQNNEWLLDEYLDEEQEIDQDEV